MNKDKNTLMWILIAIVILLFILGSIGIGNYGMMGLGMGFGFLFMLLFWGMVIWIIITLVSSSFSSRVESSDAMAILKERYAKGEITKKNNLRR